MVLFGGAHLRVGIHVLSRESLEQQASSEQRAASKLVKVNCKYATAACMKVWVEEGRGLGLQADYNLCDSANPSESVIDRSIGLR